MKFLRFFAIAGCLLLVGVATFGATVTLKFWHPWPDQWFEPRMGPVIELFELVYPDIDIEVIQVPFPEYDTKLTTACVSGTFPDVAFINNVSTKTFLAQGCTRQSLDNWVTASEVIDPDDYYPGWWNVGFQEGVQYYLPLNTDCRALFYNKHLFEEIGLEAAPTDWDEFLAAAKELTKDGVYGYGFRGGSGWDVALDELGTILVQLDGWLISQDGKKVQITPEVRRAFERMGQMFDEGIVQPTAMTDKSHELVPLFTAGRIASFIENPGAKAELERNGWVYGEDFGIVMVPYSSGTHPGSAQGGWFIGMNRDGQHKDEAWLFMEFTQRPEITTFSTGELLPIRISAAERFTVWDKAWLSPFVETLKYSRPPLTPVPQLPAIGEAIREEFGVYVSGRQTFDQMLENIETTLTELLQS